MMVFGINSHATVLSRALTALIYGCVPSARGFPVGLGDHSGRGGTLYGCYFAFNSHATVLSRALTALFMAVCPLPVGSQWPG